VIPSQSVDVGGFRMAYREVGAGRPIVLLHGNPTSSILWRHVQPALAGLGRTVAPDLLGMGESGRPTGSACRFVDHRDALERLLDALDVADDVVLVGHDWGGVLATDWARRHEAAVAGVVILETLVAPVSWDGPNAPEPSIFRPLRGPDGERMVLDENVFIEVVLQAGTLRRLASEELDAYRAPFREPGESRRPMLTWAREIPIDGEPADVHELVAANAAWMGATAVPKLLVDGDPGALLTGPLRDLVRTWPAVTEVTVPGLHFLPEDSPGAIADALAAWITGLP
jgi:haloalkane dehalogenase